MRKAGLGAGALYAAPELAAGAAEAAGRGVAPWVGGFGSAMVKGCEGNVCSRRFEILHESLFL